MDDYKIPFYMGYLVGAFKCPEIRNYFINKGLSEITINAVEQGMMEMASVFYQDR